MNGKPWTDEEIRILTDRYPGERSSDIAKDLGRSLSSVYGAATKLGLSKDLEVVARMARERTLRPDHGGRKHQFKKGHVPANKGTKGIYGKHPNTVRTQFKPGSKPQTTMPIGSLRITKDGYLERKTNNRSGNNSVRWRPVHQLVWIEANGPIPENHVVVFRPGCRTTNPDEITIDKVELISRQELMRRNTIHRRYPPELARALQLTGALTRQINRRKKDEQH